MQEPHAGRAGPPEAVYIVGAGIAGLAAAARLQASGWPVVVLEARARLGGRIWTERSWGDVAVDLGASWIHGIRGNPLAVLVRRWQIPTCATDYEGMTHFYAADGTRLAPREYARLHSRFEQLLDEMEERRAALVQDHALGSVLEQAMARQSLSERQRQHLRHYVHTMIEQDYGTEVGNLSLWHWDEWHAMPGVHVIFPQGYDQLIEHLAQGIEVKLEHLVQQIACHDTGVQLSTNRGTFVAARVIVTVPLGVLQRGNIRFVPPLPPSKTAAIQRLRMGVLNKLYLRFPARFWPAASEWLEYSGAAPWVEFFNLGKYLDKPLLVGLSVGERGRALEQDSDQANVAAAMRVLRTIYGASIPDPIAWRMTRWDADPLAAGAYLTIPPGASGADCDALAEPIGERLLFAGEATQRWDYGTVHGAFWSGEQAARRLLEPESAAWVASRQSPVYHVSPACMNAQEIPSKNRICGPAAQQGRRPHAGCPHRVKTPLPA